MSTLTDFLLARIAEDEVAANAANDHDRWFAVEDQDDSWVAEADVTGQQWRVALANPVPATHIARHDPIRVLAECEAKRRTLEVAQLFGCAKAIGRYLALPYADHPDYREEWRP